MSTRSLRILVAAALMVLAAVLIVACSGQPGGLPDPTATVPPTQAPSATPAPDEHGMEPTPGAVITGTAQVETLDLLILESFPVQVQAQVAGYVGDGCTTLDDITQVREDDTFKVTITTTRPAEAMCTQQLVGFEETIALDVAGLPAGTYTVDVNGVTDTFTLDVDNTLEN